MACQNMKSYPPDCNQAIYQNPCAEVVPMTQYIHPDTCIPPNPQCINYYPVEPVYPAQQEIDITYTRERTAPAPMPMSAPMPMQAAYQKEQLHIHEYLRGNIGNMVQVEVLVGNNATYHVGYLRDVNSNYIVLEPPGGGMKVMCDIHSIKHAVIYETYTEKKTVSAYY